jgi:hypothetical protein
MLYIWSTVTQTWLAVVPHCYWSWWGDLNWWGQVQSLRPPAASKHRISKVRFDPDGAIRASSVLLFCWLVSHLAEKNGEGWECGSVFLSVRANCCACRDSNYLPQTYSRAPPRTASPPCGTIDHHTWDWRRAALPSSIVATTTPRELLRARLQHQRQYQLLSIRSGPSKIKTRTERSQASERWSIRYPTKPLHFMRCRGNFFAVFQKLWNIEYEVNVSHTDPVNLVAVVRTEYSYAIRTLTFELRCAPCNSWVPEHLTFPTRLCGSRTCSSPINSWISMRATIAHNLILNLWFLGGSLVADERAHALSLHGTERLQIYSHSFANLWVLFVQSELSRREELGAELWRRR